jgi:hypothetical protein
LFVPETEIFGLGELVPVPVVIWMFVPPLPIFRLFFCLQLGEVTILVPLLLPVPVSAGLAIIPVVVVLVLTVVVPLLVFVFPLSVILMPVILPI